MNSFENDFSLNGGTISDSEGNIVLGGPQVRLSIGMETNRHA